MASAYDHKKIEKKWQEKWEKEKAFAAQENSDKQKLYVLDMFPYPSGAGLHVGHVEGYTATDIYSRFKRMQGYNVLHPMGWDAFGLPAENYAVKTGVPPAKTTADAINTFRSQIKNLGFSYDWDREIGTHTPEYYKWTQWFFLFLYKNGLAYKKTAMVNWDPVDQTVLANEQVLPDGTAERSGAKVVQKELEQWFFKITDFADALVQDLDLVDWPESTKINQRNWIGRSEGAEIDFSLKFDAPGDHTGAHIKVFTTRPDTLFGATYLVLSPEHLWVKLATDEKHDVLTNKDEVRAYVEAAGNKTDRERQEGEKDKTGVEIKGVRAINPATKEEVPIFVADYVLGSYGTGAIMAVPAHDERDFAFAKKFDAPIREVVVPDKIDTNNPPREGKKDVPRRTIQGVLRHSDGKIVVLDWKQLGWKTLVIGGVEDGEELVGAATREIREETGYKNIRFVRELGDMYAGYFAKHKDENRRAYATGMLFELIDEEQDEIAEEEKQKHEPIWMTVEEALRTVIGVEPPTFLTRLDTDGWYYLGSGTLVHSGEFTGLMSEDAKKKITEFVGGTWVTRFKLRDWLISRQRYWGAPIPIVYDPEGKPHPIPEEHLPWMLPTDVEFKPTGTSPLGASKELLERTEKIFGKGWKPEVDTMDTFVCSSWYYYRFADPHNDKEFASKTAIQKWLPVDLYMGGAEHTVLHLMYARFFTKALQKFGYVNFTEPFLKLRHQGTILAEDGTKMSKSKGIVINPDEVIELFGADSLRLYEMFMGPLEAMKPWNTQNIMGVRRFLERVWKLEVVESAGEVPVDQTIKKVTEDLEALKFNTAISALMILLNKFEKQGTTPEAYGKFLKLLAPLAPHIAHELAHEHDVDLSIWPIFDPSKVLSVKAQIAVQVNGKVRARVELSTETGEQEALDTARKEPNVAKWLALGKETKAVYVRGKIISFVVESKGA